MVDGMKSLVKREDVEIREITLPAVLALYTPDVITQACQVGLAET